MVFTLLILVIFCALSLLLFSFNFIFSLSLYILKKISFSTFSLLFQLVPTFQIFSKPSLSGCSSQ